MYIIKNAWKSICRCKGRNILMGVAALLIATSCCIALSIRAAANTAKESALSSLHVTAQITYNRENAVNEAAKQMGGGRMGDKMGSMENGAMETPSGDFSQFKKALSSVENSLTLDQYMTYAKALKSDDSWYYTQTASMNTSGSLLPYGESSDGSASATATATTNATATANATAATTAKAAATATATAAATSTAVPESTSTTAAPTTASTASANKTASATASSSGSGKDENISGGMGEQGRTMSSDDFYMTGFSSYAAMMSLFGSDGTCSIATDDDGNTLGKVFDTDASDNACMISKELALWNDLSVGDTITLSNPNNAGETYSLTISGIYTNSASGNSSSSRFSRVDPANNIYVSNGTLQGIVTNSTTNATTDSEGTSTALTEETAFTYVFSEASHYYDFQNAVQDLGLSDEYKVESSDISAYESSLEPLSNLSQTAFWFLIVILSVGAVILVILNIFSIHNRKYEIGVLAAVGMKKGKVATQFILEIFMVTFVAIVIGAVIGAVAAVPATNALLAKQIASTSSATEDISQNLGFQANNAQSLPSSMAQPSATAGASTSASASASAGASGAVEASSNQKNWSQAFGTAKEVKYVSSVTSATDFAVLGELLGIGLLLTLAAGMTAVISVMRYEPLKILSNRE